MASLLNAIVTLDVNNAVRYYDDRAGQWSIRVNDRFRICFLWMDGNAEEVEIVDYH